MPREKKISLDQWQKAILEGSGVLCAVASKLGISRFTVARHRDKDPKIAEMFKEALAIASDQAEANILTALQGGNLKVSMWFLERKAKDRGYGKELKVETDSKIATVQVVLPDNGRTRL